MNEKPVVELKHVSKKIGKKEIIHDLSFTIPAGEIFGFLGPNGAGKTTTIRMITGLIKITEGDIFIKGHSITTDFKKAIQNVGGIVENPDLYKYLTGYQNLKHYARMSPGISKKRIYEMAEIVGLKDKIQDKVRTYSLGMRQRLGLAQVLLHRPSLVILDEPTNGLDPEGIHELRNYLKKIAHEEGAAVLASSHLLSEMQLMCDRVGVLQHGKLVTIQRIDDFVKSGGSIQVELIVSTSQIAQTKNLLHTMGKNVLSSSPAGHIIIQMTKEEIPSVNKHLMKCGIEIYSIQIKEETLEDKFLEITEEQK